MRLSPVFLQHAAARKCRTQPDIVDERGRLHTSLSVAPADNKASSQSQMSHPEGSAGLGIISVQLPAGSCPQILKWFPLLMIYLSLRLDVVAFQDQEHCHLT